MAWGPTRSGLQCSNLTLFTPAWEPAASRTATGNER